MSPLGTEDVGVGDPGRYTWYNEGQKRLTTTLLLK
jgi:hypothetical protein